MHRFSLRISLLLCFLLAACTKPDTRTDSGEGTFIVKSASGSGEPIVQKDSPLNVPTVVRFGFEACLQDRANRTDLRSQKFFVEVPGSTRGWDLESSKERGCIHWTEEIPYDFFAGESGWVRIKRVIQGRGVNTGSQAIEFAINPWAAGKEARDDGKSVIFLREGDNGLIPQQLRDTGTAKAFLSGDDAGQKGKAQLVVQEVKVKAIKEGEGNGFETLTYVVTMRPKIKVTNSNGVVDYKKAPDGTYNLWMMLMASQVGPQMDQRTGILAGQPFTVAEVRDGNMQAELHIRQDKMANQGNLELALRIVPQSISGRTSIGSFDAVVPLGAGNFAEDGGGNVSLTCFNERDKTCNYDRILASLKNSADLEKAGYLRDLEAYTFSNLKLRFLMVQPGETATQRTVAYTASVCIRETRSGKPLANTPMTIRYIKSAEQHAEAERDVISQPTDSSGCLNWDGMAFHKYYQPEEYFERLVSIEKAPDFKKPFKFYINPWDTNINFGFDEREFTPEKISEIRGRYKIPSRFFLGGYQYHTVRFLYNIDPFMDLEVKKTVLMELVPEVLRYSGIKDARKMTEHLRDGIYLLKVGIQKSYLDPRDNSELMLENSDVPHDKDGKPIEAKRAEGAPENFGRAYPRLKGQGPHDATDEDHNSFKGNVPGIKKKEFITTTTTLVRVVSGLIIVPIELTMRDLRLMRVRSNFLIELQTVDERMIQAWQVLSDRAIQKEGLVEELQKYREALNDDRLVKRDADGRVVPWISEHADNLSPELKKLYEDRSKVSSVTGDKKVREAYDSLEAKVLRTQKAIQGSLTYIKERFERGGPLGTYLNSSAKSTGVPYEVLKDGQAPINDNFELNSDVIEQLRAEMQVNDFSKVKLPTAKDVDNLDIFVERDSGLKERTFVGPVIFLSNAYSDSARATDNLDEEFGGALCRENSLKQTDLSVAARERLRRSYTLQESIEELSLNSAEAKLRLGIRGDVDSNNTPFENDSRWKVGQSNNATRYSQYYGSLSHLCFKQVDDLIESEKALNRERENRMLRVALKANFLDYGRRVLNLPLEYVSLTDEPLQVVKSDCGTDADVRTCLQKTTEGTIPAKRIPEWLVPGLANARWTLNWQPFNLVKWWRNQPTQSSREAWNPEDYHSLFFERTLDSKVGLCNLLANKISNELADKNLMPRGESLVQRRVLNACTKDGGLVHDIKLHIGKTGEYTFLGGMNLNINVGESFSTSWSHSWGTGVELADFIGTPVGWSTGAAKAAGSAAGAMAGAAVGGLMIKPVNLKVGWGLSDSEGTSISESTYLVSQVAGFKLNLEQYEKCAIVALTQQSLKTLENGWGIPDTGGAEGAIMPYRGPDWADIRENFRGGLFVCEGATRMANKPREVKEMYFYFTQHFTEGDMLDQADLYNHPWLLAMRGMRDFMTFVGKIRSQYVVNLGSFINGMTGAAKPNQKAWALDHMARVYQSVLPTFPGFYSVLEEKDDIPFLLEQTEQRLSKVDRDPLGEINRKTNRPENGGFDVHRRMSVPAR